MLAGVGQLKPLQQGNLSNMCGLYSVLNAVQLAVYPQRLTRPELQYLLSHRVCALRATLPQTIPLMSAGVESGTTATPSFGNCVHFYG